MNRIITTLLGLLLIQLIVVKKTFSDEEIENLSNQIIDTVITSFAASLRK